MGSLIGLVIFVGFVLSVIAVAGWILAYSWYQISLGNEARIKGLLEKILVLKVENRNLQMVLEQYESAKRLLNNQIANLKTESQP